MIECIYMDDSERHDVAQFMSRIWENFKIPLMLGAGSIVLLATAFVLFVKTTQHKEPIQFSTNQVLSEATHSASVMVDIQGAVVQPGVYKLPSDARIVDAIAKAGGFTEEADMAWVGSQLNQSQRIRDELKLYIPHKNENITSHNIGSGAGSGTATVRINSATQQELESLPGVGPVTAAKIIAGRPYTDIQDLVVKQVMGQKLLDKLRNQLSL